MDAGDNEKQQASTRIHTREEINPNAWGGGGNEIQYIREQGSVYTRTLMGEYRVYGGIYQ